MVFVESLPINLRLKGWTGHKYLSWIMPQKKMEISLTI